MGTKLLGIQPLSE